MPHSIKLKYKEQLSYLLDSLGYEFKNRFAHCVIRVALYMCVRARACVYAGGCKWQCSDKRAFHWQMLVILYLTSQINFNDTSYVS
jgi:hypothetical protein